MCSPSTGVLIITFLALPLPRLIRVICDSRQIASGAVSLGWGGETEILPLGTKLPPHQTPNPTSPKLANHPIQEGMEDGNLSSWKQICPLGGSLSTLSKNKSLNPGDGLALGLGRG